MILLDLKDSRPIYEQVVEKMQELMMLGILEEDGQMPSVRSLAMELSINPNTIQRAYGELERRGYIYSVKGRGSFVGSIHKLREARKQELSKKIGGLAKEARTIGMNRGDFVEMAAREYDQNGKTTSAGGLKAAGRCCFPVLVIFPGGHFHKIPPVHADGPGFLCQAADFF